MRRLAFVTVLVVVGVATAKELTVAKIDLPGVKGGIGFDDLRYASSLGKVVVPGGRTGGLFLINPTTKKVSVIAGVSEASSGFKGGHGEGTTSADEGPGVLFATDRGARSLVVVEPASGKVVARVPLGAGPDYVRWVAPRKEVWVTEPRAKLIEVFAVPEKGPPARTAKIEVPDGPESLVVDAERGRAYTHEWGGTTLAIDLAAHKVVATWANGCKGSRGVALDEKRGFLIVGCDDGRAAVLDVAHDGKQLGELAAGVAGVDVIAYDASRGRLYLPGEDSRSLAIVEVGDDGALKLLGKLPTAEGAHCATTDGHRGVWICDPGAGRLLYVEDTL